MKITQEQKVINYIKQYNSITSLDAFRDLGITRLSAKIFNLKKMGYQITDTTETGKNRFGEDTHYKRYTITNLMEMENMNHIPRID